MMNRTTVYPMVLALTFLLVSSTQPCPLSQTTQSSLPAVLSRNQEIIQLLLPQTKFEVLLKRKFDYGSLLNYADETSTLCSDFSQCAEELKSIIDACKLQLGSRRGLEVESCTPCTSDEPQCTHPGQASQSWCDDRCADGVNDDHCPAGYCTCGDVVATSTTSPTGTTTDDDEVFVADDSIEWTDVLDNDPIRICYFENWVRWTMPILEDQDIFSYGMDASLCTHISYGFGAIADQTWEVQMYDIWADPDAFEGLNQLKSANPHLKSLYSMGGWTWNDCHNYNYPTTGAASCHVFSTLVDSVEATRTHAQHAIKFLRDNNFDGYDIDWEYPVIAGRNSVDDAEHPEDYDNYVRFLRILREEFEAEAVRTGKDRLLLTAAVGVGIKTVPKAYNIPAMNDALDWIGLMTYDLHGSWDGVTGLNAGLYHTEADLLQYGSPYSVEWAVDYWLEHGADAHKLVLGVAPYGRGFTLATPGQNQGPLSAISGASSPGPQVNEPGYHSYMEVVDYLAAGGVEYWDEDRQTPYMISADGSEWIGYDNPRSLKLKTEFMMEKGLRGTMAWAIELDDFRNEEFPCLNMIKDTMEGYQLGTSSTTPQNVETTSIPTALPTEVVTTAAPTAMPTEVVTTAMPTESVTTAMPTESVTTAMPTEVVTTIAPTKAVTTATPSEAVTSAAPTAAVVSTVPTAQVAEPTSAPTQHVAETTIGAASDEMIAAVSGNGGNLILIMIAIIILFIVCLVGVIVLWRMCKKDSSEVDLEAAWEGRNVATQAC